MNARLLAILVVVVALPACVVHVGNGWGFDLVSFDSLDHERVEHHEAALGGGDVFVENFAGDVTVRSGTGATASIAARIRAADEGDLDRVSVELDESGTGLAVITRKPGGLSNVAVELVIELPVGSRSLEVRTGAGDVLVESHVGPLWVETGAGDVDATGTDGRTTVHTGAGDVDLTAVGTPLLVRTGAGDVDVRGGLGSADIETGAGDIDYEGALVGENRFSSGAGDVSVQVEGAADVEIEASASVGDVHVEGLDFSGKVGKRSVSGTLGRGGAGSVRASSGAGDVEFVRR